MRCASRVIEHICTVELNIDSLLGDIFRQYADNALEPDMIDRCYIQYVLIHMCLNVNISMRISLIFN